MCVGFTDGIWGVFNSILVNILFHDVSFLSIIFICVIFLFFLFFNLNVNSSVINKSLTSHIVGNKTTRTINNVLMVRAAQITGIFTIFFIFFFRGVVGDLWFGHLFVDNSYLWVFLLLIGVCFFVITMVGVNTQMLQNVGYDYFFAVGLLTLFLPLMFFSSNVLTFFFVLEVISGLILYQFIVGRDWEILINEKRGNFINTNLYSTSASLVNIVFFQYWVSFFGSVLLVYGVLILFLYYGTTEFGVVNFLGSFDLIYADIRVNFFVGLICIVIIIAFILKLGLAPVHFYKIEIYKGLPFLTILFYTIFFFMGFFLYFCFVVLSFLNFFSGLWWVLGVLIVVCGSVIVIFLLFDVTIIRAFFAYSTVINSLGFFVLLISLMS